MSIMNEYHFLSIQTLYNVYFSFHMIPPAFITRIALWHG
jgi:hypothetical protein